MSFKLLDILVKDGVIDEAKSDEVKVINTKTKKPIEQILLELNYASEVQIAKAKGEEFNIPFVDLNTEEIQNEAVNLVNPDLLKAHRAFPYQDSPAGLKVAMVDPFDIPAIQALQRSISDGKKLRVYIAAPSQVKEFIDKRVGQAITSEVSEALEDVEQPVTEITDEDVDISQAAVALQNAPVARIVNSILQYGAKINSSDIHIEPMEKLVRVRYRVNGVMSEKLKLPKSVHSAIVARIKILSKMKIDEKRVPQDGRFPIKIGERRIDLRVSSLPTVFGEKIVMRLLERTRGVQPIEDSGLRGNAYKTYIDEIKATTGIILITGPTGCGKSTTLAGTISKINKPEVNIITVEDPVEIRIPGVNQVQINPDAGLTFASGLRSILRQDPDIIMVGEIRDEETARLAVQAALTGHLVLSTLHTNSASSALPRLLDMQIEPYLLAAVMNMTVAQRLPRRICNHCKEPYVASQEVIDDINKKLSTIHDFNAVNYLLSKCQNQDGTPKEGLSDVKCPVEKGGGQYDIYLYRGKGCDECGHTGFSGRIGIFEVLKISEKIGRMIMERRSSDEIEHVAVKDGMITMVQDGFLKALEGITTIEEVLRVSRE
ncbi:Flp pilus assembly complex ATPase component TadA [Candidatus Dojkabacteria bacterium]|nr:Flp pilus assembly complex ATPase component TadA [Candidatus Dojkabacteria bacterium]